jgi:DNA repair protein RadA/Sms
MSKTKIVYICTSCAYESLRWLGKCPACDSWNSFTEELTEVKKNNNSTKKGKPGDLYLLQDISVENEKRIKTDIIEFDRVLGGGIIPGSVILLGGDPGIGKSTLVMQAAAKLSCKTLYVTGEESIKQIKVRGVRLNAASDNLYILAETQLERIIETISSAGPSVVIIDSIQTVYKSNLDNSPGTITQIRECAATLAEEAKKNNFAVILIGHVTKEGTIAGPKILEHMVDTVLQFEGDNNHVFRILRAQKNRFGSTNEIGIFEMYEDGLREVLNPSELFLSERDKEASGSAVTASMEGTRPILIEVQALVTPSSYGNPQRVTTGFDYRRLSILLAVLEKRGSLRLSATNVFVNMAGGVRIDEPAVDLAVCCSIASSLLNKIIDTKTIIVGEVGLGGEVRSIGNIDKRIQEAEKLGFTRILLPSNNFKNINKKSSLEIKQVENINQALSLLF